MMNENPNTSYVYCTPFVKEIDRIKEGTYEKFIDPKNFETTKINDFNVLLMNGYNIAVTHCTFANSTEATIDYIRQGNYTLILDEVLDVLVDFNTAAEDDITKSDIKLLFNEGFIKTDTYGKVHWLKGSYANAKYSNVERLAKRGNLYYLDDTMLVWQFPPEIFKAFKKVYIMTYMFEGSYLKPYFEYHDLDFEIKGITKINNRYELQPYQKDYEERRKYKELITIYPQTKGMKASSLCKSWFARQNKKQLKALQNNIFNFFHNVMKAKSEDIMWTCPKKYISDLKGKGYNIVRRMTEKEKGLPKKDRKELEDKLNCFVSLNARATNDFSKRSVLAYVYNFYANPYIKRYFENKNQSDGTNIGVDEDYLALSCLIQWIWRSRIRNGKPISVYIPSDRMRELLQKWLNCQI